VVGIPANAMAEDLGNIRAANMVILGAFIKKSKLVALQSLMDGLLVALKGDHKLITLNKNALNAGYNLFP
jgi:2-oxoglutarate ferredoxin oxidoreductase subunit gamma